MLVVENACIELGRNAGILCGIGNIEVCSISIKGGCFHTIGEPSSLAESRIDATGKWLVPGFIDLQLNGGFGHDFTTNPKTIWEVAAKLPQFGVTSFLPTIITSPLETIEQAQAVINTKSAPDTPPLANVLGLHLEGPFLNPAKKGAHNADYILPPMPDVTAEWSPQTGVRLVTLAPEMPGALPMIKKLIANGVVVSAGHSMATFDEAMAGFNAGIRYATHLFNAMPPLHHRDPGLPGAALADERITIGLIPDGVHVHPALVKSVWQMAGSRLNAVTDGMAALGMPDGSYDLGDYTVGVKNGEARLANGTLAGSIVQPPQMLTNLTTFTGASLKEILPTVTTIPAELLGMGQRKGKIAPGYDADFVLLNSDYSVHATYIGGRLAYQAN